MTSNDHFGIWFAGYKVLPPRVSQTREYVINVYTNIKYPYYDIWGGHDASYYCKSTLPWFSVIIQERGSSQHTESQSWLSSLMDRHKLKLN